MRCYAFFLETVSSAPGWCPNIQEKVVTKPPKSTPHSDIEGVHKDERRNVDTALESSQDNSDVERAAEESVGRPPRSDEADDGAPG